MDVRYRKGYITSAAETAGAADRDAIVRDAIWSPVESSGISLAGRIEKVNTPKPTRCVLPFRSIPSLRPRK